MPRSGSRHLYRNARDREAEIRDFERRYGKEHGREVYNEVVGKVAREQAAHEPGGVKVEHVKGHISFNSRGAREVVRPHEAFVHAHPHSHGHHGGRCDGGCRRSAQSHKHRRGSSARG